MPLFWVSLAFLCGILLSRGLPIPVIGWGALALLALATMLPQVYRHTAARIHLDHSGISKRLRIPSSRMYLLMLLFISLGALRYQLSLPKIAPDFIAYYNDQPAETLLVGTISAPPDVRESYTNLRVKLEQIRSAGQGSLQPVGGMLLARVPASATYNYGDRLQLQGKLQTPPENADFSFRDYLANQGIYSYLPYPSTKLVAEGQGSWLMTRLYDFRAKALALVYRLYPDPEASLMAGILLGVQAGISPQVQEAFRLTGTSHIIVISGFNITIIAGMLTLLFSRTLGRYRGALAAAIGIILYTLLVGANAAVVRAAILGLLSLLGHLVGRRQAGLNSLTFVGGVMAAISPSVLWDVSFQLSFAATLGIMLYAEPMTERFIRLGARLISAERAERLAEPVSEYFLLTLAAQITTLPLMLYYFKRLSLIALIANPLILPAQPALMVLGGISVLSGLVIQPLGQLFAWAAWPFTAYSIHTVEWLATIPHGSLALGQVALVGILLFYAALLSITFARDEIKGIASRLTPAIPLAVLGITTILVWEAALSAPDGQLHVTVLDVGSGEAVLVESPGGRSVLINGGASTNELSESLGRQLPFFDRTLDWLVVADIDEQDLAGVAGNLERFKPAAAMWAGNTYGTRAAGELWAELGKLSISTTMTEAGQALDLGDEAQLKVLRVSENGAMLLLEWKNFRLLLPLGVNVDSLDELQHNSAMRDISALLLAESGYAPTNPPRLLYWLNPQVTLLSVAAADKEGLPSPETIQALEGYNLLRTDQNGWIEVTTDGDKMWVEVEKK